MGKTDYREQGVARESLPGGCGRRYSIGSPHRKRTTRWL